MAGLIILPKLLRHILLARRYQFAEGFLRIHYLDFAATTTTAILLLFLIPFEEGLRSIWLPLAAAPYFLLYGRRSRPGWLLLEGSLWCLCP